ncbi:MAG: glycoside hydrolase family 16 [Candidatus Acidoferrum typicum]|nr:glycoside hydrolase family 16 [Candidatus Acidoferrum typicum]
MVGMYFYKCLSFSRLRRSLLTLSGVLLFAIQANSQSVPNGTAKAEPAAPASGLMEVTPDAVSFVDVPVGDTYTQTVRITNVNEGTLQIRKITVSSPNFQITGILLPVIVAHGTSQTFTISYQAKTQGRMEGQISILTSSGDVPLVLGVKASSAAGQTELTANAAAFEFEDVAVGSSGKKELVLTNSGNRDLKISGISASGAGFSVSGATAVNLSPGQNVNVDVNFAPKSAARQTGSLKVSSAEGGSLLTIPLTAGGAPPSQSTVKLNWEESPVTVAGYVVYRSAEASGPYMRVSSSAVPSAEYVDTGLAAGHTYYYVVSSLDADQVESEYSPPISATVPVR